MRIVGGDALYAILLREANKEVVNAGLIDGFQAVPLKLDVVVIPEDSPPLQEFLLGRSFSILQENLRNFGGKAAGGRDQALTVLTNKFFVDPRPPLVVALGITKGAKFSEVLITRAVFGQH